MFKKRILGSLVGIAIMAAAPVVLSEFVEVPGLYAYAERLLPVIFPSM